MYIPNIHIYVSLSFPFAVLKGNLLYYSILGIKQVAHNYTIHI